MTMDRYEEALKRAKEFVGKEECINLEYIFPELKESENEKIKKVLINYFNEYKEHEECGIKTFYGIPTDNIIAWLEKQNNTNEIINRDEFAQGVLRGAAINLITWIDYNSAEGNMCLSNMECKDIEDALVHTDWNKIYAYLKKKLEKQDEKPQGKTAFEAIKEEKVDNVNKVEPKFKVGDWIISHYNNVAYIESISETKYNLQCKDGYHEKLDIDCINRNWRLWTIQDAKDGDVLAIDSGRPFIFKGCLDEGHANSPVAYCGIDIMHRFRISSGDTWWTDRKVHPATKEQHDLLFTKMKEAGYKLDEKFNVVKI